MNIFEFMFMAGDVGPSLFISPRATPSSSSAWYFSTWFKSIVSIYSPLVLKVCLYAWFVSRLRPKTSYPVAISWPAKGSPVVRHSVI